MKEKICIYIVFIVTLKMLYGIVCLKKYVNIGKCVGDIRKLTKLKILSAC